MAVTVGSAVGSGAMLVVGGVVAAVTIVGLVSSQVNSSGDNPANSSNATIPYGSVK